MPGPCSVAMLMVGRPTEAIYRRYHIVDEQDLRDAAARLDDRAGAAGKVAEKTVSARYRNRHGGKPEEWPRTTPQTRSCESTR